MIAGGVAGAGAIGGAALSANAVGNAASQQSNAANYAAQLQYQASQNALNFQEQQWNQEQQNEQPWLQSGTGALSNLDYLMGITPPASYSTNPTTSTPSLSATNPSVGSGITQANGGMPPQQAYGATSGARPVSTLASLPGTIQANGGTTIQPSGSSGFSSGTRNGGAYGSAQAVPASGARSGSGGLTLAGSTPSTGIQGGYGSLMTPYSGTFTAPTAAEMEQNDPGYQARLQLGTDALQRSAAAAGGVVTGGTAQALNQYAQDYASNEYNNYYNQAYNTYATNYNQYEQQQANEYNRLASLAGVGQTAANQLATSGQAASNNVSSNLLNTANSMGQSYQNAAAANASGIVGSANAWNGGIGSTINNLYALQGMYNQGSQQQAASNWFNVVNGTADPLGLV